MSRQKCYNCPDLLEHIMEKDSQHFQEGLVHFGNGRFLPHHDEDIPAVEEFVLQQRARAEEVDVSNR